MNPTSGLVIFGWIIVHVKFTGYFRQRLNFFLVFEDEFDSILKVMRISTGNRLCSGFDNLHAGLRLFFQGRHTYHGKPILMVNSLGHVSHGSYWPGRLI